MADTPVAVGKELKTGEVSGSSCEKRGPSSRSAAAFKEALINSQTNSTDGDNNEHHSIAPVNVVYIKEEPINDATLHDSSEQHQLIKCEDSIDIKQEPLASEENESGIILVKDFAVSVPHNELLCSWEGQKLASSGSSAKCRLKCSECGYETVNKSNLTRHFRTHTGEKPFACAECNYKTSQKMHLIAHMRTHTGEKPFPCDECNYKSSLKIDLIRHMRTHTGDKPFPCSECNYKAAQKMHLVQHMRTHTGEKPFACAECNFKTALKLHLNEHMRTHTGEKPFACSECNYKAALKVYLIQHMRKHAGEKPFPCSE